MAETIRLKRAQMNHLVKEFEKKVRLKEVNFHFPQMLLSIYIFVNAV